MHHEQLAMERHAMRERINELEVAFKDMHSDFARCAKSGISPCFFCENDEICNGCPDNCNFKWHAHV